MKGFKGRLVYIVGDSYSELSELLGVITVTQFFKAVFDGSLPINFTWMLGKGITCAEKNLLKLCEARHSEIRFYGVEEIKSTCLSPVDIRKSIFSKLSQLMANLARCLGFSR